MSELLNNLGKLFTNYVTLANIMAVLTFLTVVCKFIAGARKAKNTRDYGKDFDELKSENETLRKDNARLCRELRKTNKALLLMIRYSRLEDSAKSKAEDILENDKEDVDVSKPVEEPVKEETPETVIEKLEKELGE